MKRKKILILNAGRAPGITFCKSLAEHVHTFELIGVERNQFSLLNACVERCYFIPPKDIDEYLKEIQKIVLQERIDLIYASKTNEELLMVSEHRDELECAVFLPSKASVRLFEDKWETYQELLRYDIPVPATFQVNSDSDIQSSLDEFGSIWLRATHGSGGNGSLPTSHFEFARAWVDSSAGWGNYTASEVLNGKTATWSAVWWEGELIVAQGRRRLYWEHSCLSPSGVSGVTGAQYTVSDPAMDEIAIEAITSLDRMPHGIISVDFTCSHEYSDPRVTEIQASRFYTSIDFLAALGLNLPLIYCSLALDIEPDLPDKPLNPLKDGSLWIKYPETLPRLTSLSEINQLVTRGGVNV